MKNGSQREAIVTIKITDHIYCQGQLIKKTSGGRAVVDINGQFFEGDLIPLQRNQD